jgi:H+/gluconate symporter-like permease
VSLVGLTKPLTIQTSTVTAIWAVEGALLLGIAIVLLTAFNTVRERFAEGSRTAVGGALLAAMNTASEYGFGGVIAALPASCWWVTR